MTQSERNHHTTRSLLEAMGLEWLLRAHDNPPQLQGEHEAWAAQLPRRHSARQQLNNAAASALRHFNSTNSFDGQTSLLLPLDIDHWQRRGMLALGGGQNIHERSLKREWRALVISSKTPWEVRRELITSDTTMFYSGMGEVARLMMLDRLLARLHGEQPQEEAGALKLNARPTLENLITLATCLGYTASYGPNSNNELTRLSLGRAETNRIMQAFADEGIEGNLDASARPALMGSTADELSQAVMLDAPWIRAGVAFHPQLQPSMLDRINSAPVARIIASAAGLMPEHNREILSRRIQLRKIFEASQADPASAMREALNRKDPNLVKHLELAHPVQLAQLATARPHSTDAHKLYSSTLRPWVERGYMIPIEELGESQEAIDAVRRLVAGMYGQESNTFLSAVMHRVHTPTLDLLQRSPWDAPGTPGWQRWQGLLLQALHHAVHELFGQSSLAFVERTGKLLDERDLDGLEALIQESRGAYLKFASEQREGWRTGKKP